MMISVCQATRGRPVKCLETKKLYFDNATNPEQIEHIFGVDLDDEPTLVSTFEHQRVVVDPKGCNHAFNQAALTSKGKLIVIIGDDNLPPKNWDKAILDKLSNVLDESAMLAVSDGWREDILLVTPILTRKRWEQQGKKVFHEYPSVYADTEFTVRAFKDKAEGLTKIIDGRDIVIYHDHPLFTGAPFDETYARQNSPLNCALGKRMFDERNP